MFFLEFNHYIPRICLSSLIFLVSYYKLLIMFLIGVSVDLVLPSFDVWVVKIRYYGDFFQDIMHGEDKKKNVSSFLEGRNLDIN